MTWTGIRDHRGGRVLRNVTAVVQSGLLARGTLMVEARVRAPGRNFDQLLDVALERGWDSGFRLTLTPRRSLEIEAVTGPRRMTHRLHLGEVTEQGLIRVTYTWNAPGRHALLTAEFPEEGRIHQLEITAPPPLSVMDLHGLVSTMPGAEIGGGVVGVAVADHIEQVGLAPGFGRGTPIQTDAGPRRIDRLQLNDRVVTADGRALPVRWITRRSLPAIGSFAPVTIRSPWFGATEDLVLAPGHRLLFGGPEADYHFGTDAVLVEARHMPGTPAPEPAEADPAEVAYFNILLDDHACIRAAGIWAETLFSGTLAKHPDILATTPLGALPAGAVPLHRRMVEPVLRAHEAAAFLGRRIA